MNLVRLIYASRFARGVGANDVQKILTVSRKLNEEAGITGVLCYDPEYFLQCLEGGRVPVNELYQSIIMDERHLQVTLLEYSDVNQRVFSNWSMAYVKSDEMTKHVFLKYGPKAVFDPFSMTAAQALGFIREIAEERHRFLEEERQRLT